MYVSKEQIAEAKRVDLLSYLKRYEPDELVFDGGSSRQYHTKTHDSLKISNGKWHWFSQNIGGTTALQYLILVKEMSFTDAVLWLCKDVPDCQTVSIRQPFSLPKANRDNKRVSAYLKNRGISNSVLSYCFKNHILYESTTYHNCVFVGKDLEGCPRYAFLRGTGRKDFWGEVEGSRKEYNFMIPAPSANCQVVSVFEAAIDLLSHMTLAEMQSIPQENTARICLGGTSPLALFQFLINYPYIEAVTVCTDHDDAGRKAASQIKRILVDKTYTDIEQEKYGQFLQNLKDRTFFVAYTPPQVIKDYNEQLLFEKAKLIKKGLQR